MGRPSRPTPTPVPAVADAAELERRWTWLHRWCSLTEWGAGVDIREVGTTVERVQHLERELDRLGLREQAERFVSSYTAPTTSRPVVDRPAWMDRADDDAA
jgi:hypothetical protein